MNILNKATPETAKLCPHCKQPVDPKASRCPHCQGKIYQWTLGKKVLAGIILFFFACIFASAMSGNSSSSSSTASSPSAPASTHVAIGTNGVLKLPSDTGAKVFVATSKAALDEFIKASVNKDTYGMAALVQNGQGFFVPQGTKVLVIDKTLGTSQVRILEGDHTGEAVWVPYEFVSPQ